MSVYDITLTDPTEPGRPATYVLHVTAVDQMVFVSICDYDEGNPETKMVAKASIGVSLPALRDALNLLSSDGFREASTAPARGSAVSGSGRFRYDETRRMILGEPS